MKLISHHLCPYVQRALIVAAEKEIRLEREYIDLSDKPAWFQRLSPTGKVPLLLVDQTVVFESAVICAYLDETSPGSILPEDPLERARHRSWGEYASAVLAEIGGLYSAPDAASFEAKRAALLSRFARLEESIVAAWFSGPKFGLVDAAFAPVFRYLEVFEEQAGIRLAEGCGKVADWRRALADRPSILQAVTPGFEDRLARFLIARGSYLSRLIEERRL